MNRYEDDPDATLDRIVSDIREDEAPPEVTAGAAGRVWARLARETADDGSVGAARTDEQDSAVIIRGCAGYQAVIPAYVARTLAPARGLLLEDHVHDCAVCRASLDAARGGRVSSKVVPFGTPAGVPERTVARRSLGSRLTLAAAAAAVLGLVGLAGWMQLGARNANTAQVHSVRGTLYRVADGVPVPVAQGASFHYGDVVRTAKDSGAVIRLADGSLVEMSERAEMSLASGRGDTTISLPRGNIIVQATKRASGHLFVRSDDALVSVTGTIFAVSHGTMGSRVSVIEGEVHVDHSGAKDVLKPGQQVTTQTTLMRVPVEQDIAWSQDVDRYVSLLREIKSLKEDLASTHLTGELRHATNLLDAQPAGTTIYFAIPNVSDNLAEADRKIQDHISQSSVLRQWWESHHGAAEGAEVQRILDKVRAFGSHLGDEVTVSLQLGESGEPSGVLMMSEVKDAESFKSFLAGEVSKFKSDPHNHGSLRVLPDDLAQAGPDGPALAHGEPSEVVIWAHGGHVVAASSVGLVREAAANLDHPGASSFTTSSFRQRIADSYRDGAGWLFAVDVESILARASNGSSDGPEHAAARSAALAQSGILDAKQFILEVKETADRTTTRGVLSFGQERRGVASWLAAPAPMGAMDYLSPDSSMMVSFVVKEPVLLVDDLFGILSVADPDFQSHLATFESESGVSIREDLAAPLGGEFAFGLDGPILPTPSWKAIVEVYDPPRLQHTIETLVTKLAEKARESGSDVPVPEIAREDAGGRTYYTIRCKGAIDVVNYVYENGYLIAAPSRALLDRAIQNRESGFVLASAQTFRDLLPQDGHVNFSALTYQNVGPLLKPIAQQMQGQMTPEQKAQVAAFEAQMGPSLAYAYGEQDRIVLAASGAGSLASQLGAGLFGMHGDAGVAKVFQGAIAKQVEAAKERAANTE